MSPQIRTKAEISTAAAFIGLVIIRYLTCSFFFKICIGRATTVAIYSPGVYIHVVPHAFCCLVGYKINLGCGKSEYEVFTALEFIYM